MRREIWSSGSMICVSELLIRISSHSSSGLQDTLSVSVSVGVWSVSRGWFVSSSLGLSSGRGSGMMSSLSSSGSGSGMMSKSWRHRSPLALCELAYWCQNGSILRLWPRLWINSKLKCCVIILYTVLTSIVTMVTFFVTIISFIL